MRYVWNESKFKYLGCVLDELGTEEAGCRRKVASGRSSGGSELSPLKVGSLVCDQAHNLGQRGKFLSFSVLALLIFYCLISWGDACRPRNKYLFIILSPPPFTTRSAPIMSRKELQ